MFQGHWIGYNKLEDFLRQAGQAQVYAASCTVVSPAQSGLEYHTHIIQVVWLDGEKTHFWRWKVGSFLMMNNSGPLDDGRAARIERAAKTAWVLVLHWLSASGAHVAEAAVAFAQGRDYLDGDAPGFLLYNRESGYSLAEPANLMLEPRHE